MSHTTVYPGENQYVGKWREIGTDIQIYDEMAVMSKVGYIHSWSFSKFSKKTVYID